MTIATFADRRTPNAERKHRLNREINAVLQAPEVRALAAQRVISVAEQEGKAAGNLFVAMWAALTHGRTWQGELVNRRKDGSLYNEEMTITPLKDDSGKVAYFIAVKQDISERKRAEGEIQRYVARLEQAMQSTINVVATIGELRADASLAQVLEQAALDAKLAAERVAPNALDWDKQKHFPIDVIRETAELQISDAHLPPRAPPRAHGLYRHKALRRCRPHPQQPNRRRGSTPQA